MTDGFYETKALDESSQALFKITVQVPEVKPIGVCAVSGKFPEPMILIR